MIFVDTWAWLALAYAKDPYHAAAVEQHRKFQAGREIYVTTDYVLCELITTLFRVLPFEKARVFMEGLRQSLGTAQNRLMHIEKRHFAAAWDLRQKYRDKPGISFTDFSSFAVMREQGISDVFTGDGHFEQVSLGFTLHPGRSR